MKMKRFHDKFRVALILGLSL